MPWPGVDQHRLGDRLLQTSEETYYGESLLMTNVYLIRHAQQIENVIPTPDPPLGPPLSSLGITQAEHLRDRLIATGEILADILLSSPLLRARATAEIIAPALDLPVTLDDDLQEFRIGNREGIADEDIGRRSFQLKQPLIIFPNYLESQALITRDSAGIVGSDIQPNMSYRL